MQRYMRGMGNGGAIRATGNEPLELDAIRARVPSVFAEAPHDSRSERYARTSAAKPMKLSCSTATTERAVFNCSAAYFVLSA